MTMENGTMSIEAAVCEVYGISLAELKSRCRRRDIVDARRIVVWYYVEVCNKTHRRSGVAVGGLKPCSARFLLNSFEPLKNTDKLFAMKCKEVMVRVRDGYTHADHDPLYSRLDLIGFSSMISGLPLQEVEHRLNMLIMYNKLLSV
jgi:hypothetical protein